MKAPDKIYIPMTPDCDIAVNDWTGVPMSQFDGRPVTANIEYIRKDALLEWAKEQFNNSCILNGDRIVAYKEIMDKLNSI